MNFEKDATFRRKMEEFDETFECLIEYFAILGFDQEQLTKVITQLQNNQQQGLSQELNPIIQARFPQENRGTVHFPTELVDLIFNMVERVKTDPNEDKLPDYSYAVCTVSDGSQIYITSHVFYEDLALI